MAGEAELTVRPSGTQRGASWIAQFGPNDRPAATALLDSIRIASADAVVNGLRHKLENYVSHGPRELPIAIFPVIAQEDMVALDTSAPLPTTPVAFVDFDPSQGLSADAGSEALVANLLHEVARAFPGGQLIRQRAGRPITIDGLHRVRCRTLVFATDYIGSGKQVVDYVSAWQRNPKIRSWLSFGWLRIVVVAFAASKAGAAQIRSLSRPPEVLVVEAAPATDNPAEWTRVGEIEDLCRNYALRSGLRRPPLGFDGSAGLFASAFSVPNNLPAILLEGSPGRWTAFFERRVMPASLAREIGDFIPPRDIVHELRLARENRLASRFEDDGNTGRWAGHLAVLALMPADDELLARALGRSIPEIETVRGDLVTFGMVKSDGVPSPQGRRELQVARRRRRKVTAGLVGTDAPYYPRLTR